MKNIKDFQQMGIALGIIILFNLVIALGFQAFYPAEKWEDYCPRSYNLTEEMCAEEGGVWVSTLMEGDDRGFCEGPLKCEENYDEYSNEYNRNVFIIYYLISIVAIIVSLFITQFSGLSIGLLYGGILGLLISTMGYWSDADDKVRFLIVLLGLIVLGALGMRGTKKKKKK